MISLTCKKRSQIYVLFKYIFWLYIIVYTYIFIMKDHENLDTTEI